MFRVSINQEITEVVEILRRCPIGALPACEILRTRRMDPCAIHPPLTNRRLRELVLAAPDRLAWVGLSLQPVGAPDADPFPERSQYDSWVILAASEDAPETAAFGVKLWEALSTLAKPIPTGSVVEAARWLRMARRAFNFCMDRDARRRRPAIR